MSERQEYFDLLVDGISGHFHSNKQTRVNKRKLLDVLFTRMNSGDSGIRDLGDAYNGRKVTFGKRSKLSSALRRACTLLNQWFDSYYEQHLDLPLRFRINSEFQLVLSVNDGFNSRSVPSLVEETGQLIQSCTGISTQLLDVYQGRRDMEHADEFSRLVDALNKAAERLRRVSGAAKRRL